jgi:hypothetical protein
MAVASGLSGGLEDASRRTVDRGQVGIVYGRGHRSPLDIPSDYWKGQCWSLSDGFPFVMGIFLPDVRVTYASANRVGVYTYCTHYMSLAKTSVHMIGTDDKGRTSIHPLRHPQTHSYCMCITVTPVPSSFPHALSDFDYRPSPGTKNLPTNQHDAALSEARSTHPLHHRSSYGASALAKRRSVASLMTPFGSRLTELAWIMTARATISLPRPHVWKTTSPAS